MTMMTIMLTMMLITMSRPRFGSSWYHGAQCAGAARQRGAKCVGAAGVDAEKDGWSEGLGGERCSKRRPGVYHPRVARSRRRCNDITRTHRRPEATHRRCSTVFPTVNFFWNSRAMVLSVRGSSCTVTVVSACVRSGKASFKHLKRRLSRDHSMSM